MIFNTTIIDNNNLIKIMNSKAKSAVRVVAERFASGIHGDNPLS